MIAVLLIAERRSMPQKHVSLPTYLTFTSEHTHVY